MSDKKTLEQIRDNGSKRHCWPREQISDVYEYGYIAGFDASTAIHQERTKKLIDKIWKIKCTGPNQKQVLADLYKMADEIEQEWGEE